MYKILIVEDDTVFSQLLAYHFSKEGWQTALSSSCREAREAVSGAHFDLIVLDVNLPDGSGLSLCPHILSADAKTCILFLTGNDTEADMLKGYAAGAFDYITKPFSVLVLCRKISAILRQQNDSGSKTLLYDDGFLSVDFSSRTASVNGCPVSFTPREYETLLFLIQNAGRILTKRQFMEHIWDTDENYVDEHAAATVISRIRGKIETDAHRYIRTSYGLGYQWMGAGTLL